MLSEHYRMCWEPRPSAVGCKSMSGSFEKVANVCYQAYTILKPTKPTSAAALQSLHGALVQLDLVYNVDQIKLALAHSPITLCPYACRIACRTRRPATHSAAPSAPVPSCSCNHQACGAPWCWPAPPRPRHTRPASAAQTLLHALHSFQLSAGAPLAAWALAHTGWTTSNAFTAGQHCPRGADTY
jgi:hypothetical protein